jgi:putative serine protease PepD
MYCKNCGQKIEAGTEFCKNCGTAVVKEQKVSRHFVSWFKMYKWVFILIAAVIVIVVLVGIFDNNQNTDTSNTDTSATPDNSLGDNSTAQSTTTVDQATIAASVVDILCSDGSSDGSGSGGSGTIITSNGLVLTNAHIIPQDSDENPLTDSCAVTLANSQGGVVGIYTGEPIIIPSLSKKYDLAFIKINGAYTNELGITQGTYPTTFPDFPDAGCMNDNVTLGEPVRIFGYPAISAGGYYLTITDGIVSSLPNDGTIITSATVDHGDSGGLAVDENGCMIGIPSAVSSDGSGSLGVIISNAVAGEFLSDVDAILNATSTSSD